MRIFLGLILTFSVSFAENIRCDETVKNLDYAYMKNLPSILSKEIVDSDVPVMSGKIVCNYNNYIGNKENNDVVRVEKGEYNGLKYRFYYSDGSGSIQGTEKDNLSLGSKDSWDTRCKIDPIDDSHFCSMQKEDITIMITKNGTNIIVGSEHYPDTQSIIRVDKAQPFKSSSSGFFTEDESENLINRMAEGSEVITRYQKWPYKANIDKSFSLYKVDVAIDILRNIYLSINTGADI